MHYRVHIAAAIFAASVLVTAAARADTELVGNGGFETGAFAPDWTAGGGTSIDSTVVNTGSYDAALPDGGTLDQTLDTSVAGQTYTLTFALADEAGDPSDTFTVTFGSSTTTITGDEASLFGGSLPSGYTAFSVVIDSSDVTGTSTVLGFSATNPNGADWNLDDVSVLASGGVVAAPEPSALVLLSGALGIAAIAGIATRRGRAARLA